MISRITFMILKSIHLHLPSQASRTSKMNMMIFWYPISYISFIVMVLYHIQNVNLVIVSAAIISEIRFHMLIIRILKSLNCFFLFLSSKSRHQMVLQCFNLEIHMRNLPQAPGMAIFAWNCKTESGTQIGNILRNDDHNTTLCMISV